MPHPLLTYFHDAAGGVFPPTDGATTYLPPLPGGFEAVVAFTGHAVIASRLGPTELDPLGPDGFGGACAPEVLLRIADGGTIGVLDVTLVGRGVGGGDLRETSAHDDHPRVRHARHVRCHVRVFGDDRGFVTLGEGMGGRREMSIELTEGAAPGLGRTFITAALALVPAGELLFAGVSPGNARSLRAFLACRFVPIASEVLLHPDIKNAFR